MTAKQLISNVDIARCNSAEFQRLAVLYCKLINHFGFNARPFRKDRPLRFESSSTQQKMRAIAYLDANIEILNECVASGESPSNSAQMLWRILKKIKATPEMDIFDKIEDGDVVEVYYDDHVQIFRNLEFFNYCSFTIDELLCGKWYNLYKRDFVTTLKMLRMAFKLLTKRLEVTTAWSVPEHVFDEVGSEEKLRHSIVLKYVSPIKNQGEMIGAICTSRATPVQHNNYR